MVGDRQSQEVSGGPTNHFVRRDMFKKRHAFDGMVAGRDPYVFASEYAVLQDGGWGNLQVCPSSTFFAILPCLIPCEGPCAAGLICPLLWFDKPILVWLGCNRSRAPNWR